MELKGIDVSSYQGTIDWAKVKASGITFAILRITEKYGIDACFEKNLTGCKSNGIPAGVYKYSYALSASEIKKEAEGVVETLAGRGLDFPVWLDLEWNTQRESLTRNELSAMIKTFRAVIVSAGYKFGIYCNVDWYDNVIPDDCKSYDFWIARYPSNDTGSVQERLRPSYGAGWQYSAAGKVSGISGSVDMDVFYKDYKEETSMDLWTKTKNLLDKQVGYLEKKSAASLDSKTANAGYNNYTKYSRDVNTWGKMGCQGRPWCATYQFWIDVMIFGLAKALEHMGEGFYNCNSVKAHAKAKGTWHTTPKLGALVIFRNGAHIGRVIEVTSTTIRTNEGNTSAGAANTVEANGGCVAEKSYTIGNSQIDGYVWIDYGAETSVPETSTETTPDTLQAQAQIHLNNYVNAGLTVDGQVGPLTKTAYRKALQTALNMDKAAGLVVDGIIGTKTKAALKKVVLRKGSAGHLVTVLEIGMLMHGIDPDGVECPGTFGNGLYTAVGKFQEAKGLTKDYEAGYNTFTKIQE